MTHIKIPATSPIVRYLCNGSQTVFSFPFPIFASDDLEIKLDGATQVSGMSIAGAGATSGGTVTFDTAPPVDTVLTLSRVLPIERMTDFIESGDFSADALNTELDYLIAAVQQVARAHDAMLRYDDTETPSGVILPPLSQRRNKGLGFDSDGTPIALDLTYATAGSDFTANGVGAHTRTISDKLKDVISIKDFGAVGDGLTDDTLAIQQALETYNAVFIPSGTYLTSATIRITAGKTLFGCGQSSIIKANANNFNTIEITEDYATLFCFRIEQGAIGLKLSGENRPCVQNSITDLTIWQAQTGIQLDGSGLTVAHNPCYWNNFARVLVAQPFVHGIHLVRSGGGDTPNANKFHACRVYSLGATTSGAGFYVEDGSFNNAFLDCEANVNGATAQACFHLGPGSNKTLLLNPYAESSNQVPNIRLDNGSIETAIYNLLSASDGAAIYDLSGGEYTAYNAGYPHKNRLQRTLVTDLTATLQRYDTEYIDSSGLVQLDTSHSVHLVSSYGGALEVRLPHAGDAVGVEMTVKKIDSSANLITLTEDSGNGPDGRSYYLGAENDFVVMLSNGAEWFVTSSNRAPGNTRFFDGSGLYDIDMAVDTYLLSSYGGALEARLPPANAPEAVGRTITLKKTDVSAHVITITEQGGSGPDGYGQPLSSQYDALTVVSDGGSWWIVGRF
ncbi:MAG: hypothetical protein H6857_02115 [Rhodospirillales bacterium]|nr:hypothetical protein [Rhodospirillales bacterium]MCB9980071.1 hypothetical protein [Rhodospirillales bacterium]